MSDALRQLLAVFDVDTGKANNALKGLDGAINSVAGKLGGLVDAFVGSALVGGLKDFIDGQITAAKETRLAAAKIGVTTDMIQEFAFAASAAGVSSEGAATGLKFLNKNMGLALEGNQESVDTFKKLGIALKDGQGNVRDLSDVIPEVANAFQKMGSQQERTAASMKIFGRQGADLLPLLDEGSNGLEKLYARFHELGGGMDQEFIAKAKDAGKAMAGMRFGFEAFKRQIAVQFFPTITAFGEKMQGVAAYINKFARETNIAKEAFVVLGIASVAASAKAYIGFAKFLGLIPKAAGFNLKTLFSLGKWGLILGGVALLALAFEDLWTAIHGGDSLIKNWLQETLGVEGSEKLFQQFRDMIDQVGMSFSAMGPAVKQVLASVGSLAVSPEFITSIEYLVRLFGSIVALTIGAARGAGNLLAFAGNTLGGSLTAADRNLGDAGKAVDQAGDAVFGTNGFFGANAFKPYNPAATVRAPISDPSNDPSSPYYYNRSGTPGATVNQTNQVTLNVNGAGDPRAVADEVTSQMREQAAASLKRGAPQQ